MSPLDILPRVAATVPLWPALGAALVSLRLIGRTPPSERLVAAITQTVLVLCFVSACAGALLWLVAPSAIDLRLGYWYQAAEYEFPLVLLFDGLSAAMSLLIATLLLATSSFSINYLHREPGYVRFFLLMLFFGAGMQLMVLAGSVELLFIGWEIVGITSVLLVGFFHERSGPVQAAVRVLVTYRICDIGLLLGGVWLHHWLGTTVWVEAFTLAHDASSSLPALAVALGLVFAAMGKSAQFPVGGWLPRAMEGPTASSAVFYGSLSVHAGVFLLLRAAPLIEQSPPARILLVVVGGVTAVVSGLSSQVSADAKSSVCYATASQVGVMFVECGLGLYNLATLHLIAHATLRYYQFLRTPSVLQDALQRRAALGRTEQDEVAARWENIRLQKRRWMYRLALERFAVETALDRWLTRPIMALSRGLDRLERRLLALHERDDDRRGPPH